MHNQKSEPPLADPRLAALQVIYQVAEKGAYANLILDRALQKTPLSIQDRHLVTELANGTIRMFKHLDWVLNLFLNRSISDLNPWLRNILRMSVYQLLFMDGVPDYAAINSGVNLTRIKAGPGLTGLANGVLRNLSRHRDAIRYPEPSDSIAYYAVYYSQPEWLVEKLLANYDVQPVLEMLRYFNQRPGVVLRTNTFKTDRIQLMARLAEDGITVQPSPRSPWAVVVEKMETSLAQSGAYQQGLFYVQNESSMLTVPILAPRPGESILDLCCGVGGKSTFIAEVMQDCGQVRAYDIHKNKVGLLKSNCARLGLSIVTGHQQDILALTPADHMADGVLLDAPCSGLGVLSRRSDSRWHKNPQDLEQLQALQAQMLEIAGHLVRPGGRLVYSTCTINPAENQGVVQDFLQRHPEFILEHFDADIGFFPLNSQDRHDASQGMLTILPGHYGTDGMFYAKLRRIKST